MNTRTAITAVALLAAALTGCGGGSKPAPAKAAPVSAASPKAATHLRPLAPVYTPKLEAASKGAVAICMRPSSTVCADALTDIMSVVGDIEDDIDSPGRHPYAASSEQIGKMNDATTTYLNEGCQGDPAADDPNSKCWAISAITVGATTLQMTLATDDLS